MIYSMAEILTKFMRLFVRLFSIKQNFLRIIIILIWAGRKKIVTL